MAGAQAAPSPSAHPPTGAGGETGVPWQRIFLLVAAVASVAALLGAAALGAGPLFLVRPPITRRAAGFFELPTTSCVMAVAQGNWTDSFQHVPCSEATAAEWGTCADAPQRHWRFSPEARRCGAARRTAAEARAALAGQRLVFAGDSVARHLYGATLRLLGEPGQGIVVGHADFQHELEGGIVLQFFWAPFPSNLTALLESGRLEGGAAAAAASRGAAEGDADEQQEAAEQLEGDQQEGEQQDGEQREQQQEQQREDEEQAQDVDALKPVEEDSSTQGEEGDEEEEEEGARRRLRRAAARRGGKRRRLAEGALDTAAAGATAPKAASQQPALVLLSSMLWHLLHVTDPADFQARLAALRDAAAGYAARQQQERRGKRGSAGGPRMVVTSGTEMFPNRMKTAQKQSNMTPANLDAYNKAVVEAGMPAENSPLSVLDLFPLTRACGEECSPDGVHSAPEVYDVALQLLLNLLDVPPGGGGEKRARLRRALR
ncbi:hypothetical protein C2E20_7231 [Micractinium conductrix]|uniref:Uncharacterized protein n=1 Tax=Micractinium conductrix TaxID=554055 RepID=A0A2P6V548_9CHLO|nr:hypothetical protein C2E20_7231 [Micractinium conductrix]|eukprot:PSC69208.1 hypothetical protein C2E20_7231 [Micractinium conductrix]